MASGPQQFRQCLRWHLSLLYQLPYNIFILRLTEVSLNFRKCHYGAISSSATVHCVSFSMHLEKRIKYLPELPLTLSGERKADSIVEGQLLAGNMSIYVPE